MCQMMVQMQGLLEKGREPFIRIGSADSRRYRPYKRDADLNGSQTALYVILHVKRAFGSFFLFLYEDRKFGARHGSQRHFISGQQGITQKHEKDNQNSHVQLV